MATNEVVRMPAGDTLRIRFSMTEDRAVVPLDGYTITVTVATTPTATTATAAGSGNSTTVVIPRAAIATAGLYHAEVSADNGAYRHTQPFHLRVEAHP